MIDMKKECHLPNAGWDAAGRFLELCALVPGPVDVPGADCSSLINYVKINKQYGSD